MNKYSEDYIYVKNHNVLAVWNKYRPLAMVYYKKIPENIRRDLYEFGFEEWMQDVYIVYDRAMNGVKLDKIKNPESYSLYIQLSQWLHNFISRDIIRDYIHNYAVKYMDYEQDDSSWDSFLGTEDSHSNIWDLIKTLPPEFQKRAEKIAFGQRTGGAKWPEYIREYILKYHTNF